MSRIGRKPVSVPDAVTVTIAPGNIAVKGPKGELTQTYSQDMKVSQEENAILVARPPDRGEHRALHGLTRSLIANMVEGVTDGFEKPLEIQGVGDRAALKGKNLQLALGFSHPVSIEAPEGIDFEVPQPTEIIVRGIDKQLVGQVAADIRKRRPPEPYKGKGIRYRGEQVLRKGGKRACRTRLLSSVDCVAVAVCALACPARRSVRVSPSTARTRASSPSSSTTAKATPWPRSTGSSPSSKPSPPAPRPPRPAHSRPRAP